MEVNLRSYNSQFYRPKPNIHRDNSGDVLILTTTWGDQGIENRMVSDLLKNIEAMNIDPELTNAFSIEDCFTKEGNTLRHTLRMANESMLRTENKIRYSCGLEIIIFMKSKNEITWAQVGDNNMFMSKASGGVQSLTCGGDLDFEFETGKADSIGGPLPTWLLGVEKTIYVQTGSVRCAAGDKIFTVSGSIVEEAKVKSIQAATAIDQLTNSLINRYPMQPFWAALITL